MVDNNNNYFFLFRDDPTKWLVHMGKQGRDTNNLAQHEISRRVVQIIVHPDYSKNTMQNDIAILVLESAVIYGPTERIRWLCLDRGMTVSDDLECYISGWGVTKCGYI